MAKKKLLFFSIFIIIILVFVLTVYNIIYKNNNIYLNNKDEAPNFISIMLEETAGSGEYKVSKSNKWPSKGYVFNKEMSYCNNGSTLTWNENDNSVSVNINKTDKCQVYFDIQPTLVEYVISQYTGTQGGNGIYYHNSTLANGAGDNSYRYAGPSDSVNNFVCFGTKANPCPTDNLYRIIGVMDGKVKLIKYDYANDNLLGTDGDYYGSDVPDASYYKGSLTTINTYYWNNATKTNTWSESNLNKVNLNTNYINNIGITWANKIATTTWKVGNGSIDKISFSVPKTAYQNEVGSSASTITYDAKIGLMYASDYYYAAGPSAWTLVGYNYNDATKDYRAATSINWIHMGMHEWIISRDSYYSDKAYYASKPGFVTSYYVIGSEHYNLFGARPSFNLLSSITYVSGSGSMSDPIRITD